MLTRIEAYLVRQPEESKTYLHVPGLVSLKYLNGCLESFTEDQRTLELLDSMVLDLKRRKSSDLRLVEVSTQQIRYILENGRKGQKLFLSLQSRAAQMDPKKQVQFKKFQASFRQEGRKLMDIIERDISQEREAAERFDRMTKEEKERFVEEVLSGND